MRAAATASLPPPLPPHNSNPHHPTPTTPPTLSLLQRHPLYTKTHPNLSLDIKEKILCLELLGIDSGKALSLNPSFYTSSLRSLHSLFHFLLSHGLHYSDLPRIFGMCPSLLTSDINSNLSPVFRFLENDLYVPPQSFRRVVNKCPRLLVSSVRDQLKPTLFYLKRLGFRDSRALAYNDPILLVSSVERTLKPKLEYLMGLGFSKEEAVGMVVRCPPLFTFSIEGNFKPKLEFFVEEMKGQMEELKGFPQYFGFSLEKRIKPRYMEAVECGVRLPLPDLLKSTDEKFQELLFQHRKLQNV